MSADANGGRLARLGSLRLTLVLLPVLAAGVAWAYRHPGQGTWAMVVPLALVAVNLSAAIATQPSFRRQVPLLVFHLALLAVILLVGLGRLTYLKGWAEVTEGQVFSGRLTGHEAGPWHPWGLERARFVNEGFEIDYAPGPTRTYTRNRVSWEAEGRRHTALIGDKDPLVLNGYRFYTTHNKGFAAVLAWRPTQGPATTGSVHLPSYPANRYRQAQEWTPPGAPRSLWLMLDFDEEILHRDRASRFHPPREHSLVVRLGEQRHAIRPGDTLRLDGGTLTYVGLRGWMGYQVYWDWTLPWLLAACLVAVLSLAWYFWRRFAPRPWLSTVETARAEARASTREPTLPAVPRRPA